MRKKTQKELREYYSKLGYDWEEITEILHFDIQSVDSSGTAGSKHFADRTIYFDLVGLPHREGGPAIKWDAGGEAYYKHGILHRTDGPAVDWPAMRHRPMGLKMWVIDGVLVFESDMMVGAMAAYDRAMGVI